MDTAVSAFSLMRATKILSTILYNAWTSIDAIIGSDMLTSNFFTGITPILFSAIYSPFHIMQLFFSPTMILNSIKKVNLFMVDLEYQMIMRALSAGGSMA